MRIAYDKFLESRYLEMSERISVHFHNEWRQLRQIGQCNWYSMHFAHLSFENNDIAKNWEISFMLLGLGFDIRIDRGFEHSRMKQIADEAYEEIKAGRTEEGGFGDE